MRNKVDLLSNFESKSFLADNAILVSAKNGIGIDQIKIAINKELDQKYLTTKLIFKKSYGQINNWLHENCKIISKKENNSENFLYKVKITKIELNKLKSKYPNIKIID